MYVVNGFCLWCMALRYSVMFVQTYVFRQQRVTDILFDPNCFVFVLFAR